MIGFYNYTVWLTYLSLISGVLGISFAMSGNPFGAVICLLISGFCDMFDGKVARTKDRSEKEENFGIQIDSLSDLVCFGVLPAVIGYSVGMTDWYFIPVFCLFVLFGLIRLAYFNVLEAERRANDGPRVGFQGLPITTSALIFPAFYLLRKFIPGSFYLVYAFVMILTGFLFISKIKVKKPGNKMVIGFCITGLILLICLLCGRYL